MFTVDLLEEGWGWQRLVPYTHGDVDWPVFLEYLKEYFIRNDGEIAAICANEKPEKDRAYFCRNAAKSSLPFTLKGSVTDLRASLAAVSSPTYLILVMYSSLLLITSWMLQPHW